MFYIYLFDKEITLDGNELSEQLVWDSHQDIADFIKHISRAEAALTTNSRPRNALRFLETIEEAVTEMKKEFSEN